jgi:hypothetical protein
LASAKKIGYANSRLILTGSKTELLKQQERAAKAEQDAAEAKRTASKTSARATILETNAVDAKAAQQRVEIELAKQQERAANAEKALLELQERIKDRHLSAANRKELVNFLKAGPLGAISVSCVGGHPEPCSFASELVEALKAGGWTVTGFSQGVMFVGASPSGLILQVHGAEKTPERAGTLQQALKRVGLDAPGQFIPGMAEDAVNLIVGSKP